MARSSIHRSPLARPRARFDAVHRAGLLLLWVGSTSACELLLDIPESDPELVDGGHFSAPDPDPTPPQKMPSGEPDAELSPGAPPSTPEGELEAPGPTKDPRQDASVVSTIDANIHDDGPGDGDGDGAGDGDGDGAGDGDGDGAGDGDAGVSCSQPSRWYADEDGDGYGDGTRSELACAKPPATTALAGDCADQEDQVHPGQTAYFGEPYKRANGDSSFDYDCSGGEQGEDGLAVAPASCGLLSLTLCVGSGYAATSRSGGNLNRYCGSLVKQTCRATIGILACETVTETAAEPYACR